MTESNNAAYESNYSANDLEQAITIALNYMKTSIVKVPIGDNTFVLNGSEYQCVLNYSETGLEDYPLVYIIYNGEQWIPSVSYGANHVLTIKSRVKFDNSGTNSGTILLSGAPTDSSNAGGA